MLEWVTEFGWLHIVGSAVVAILPILAAASLSAFLTTWLEERRRVRRAHLDAIKAEILRPLRQELEGFYLPLLSGTLGPVTIANVAERVPGSADHPSTPLTNWGQFQLCGARPAQTAELDRILYADAKSRHYERFFRRLELFKSEVDVHTGLWIRYAEQLSLTIRERIGLRVISEADPLSDAEWIDPDGLAVFVVNFQLGIVQRVPCLGPDGRSIEISGVTMARAQSEDPIQRSVKVLEELCWRQETPDELRPQAQPLLHLAQYLLRELDRLRLSRTYPGQCPLAGA